MRTPVRVLILVAVVGAVTWGLWATFRVDPIRIEVATVERGLVEVTVANTRAGTVHARRRSLLAPSAGGQVAVLPVREGDMVTKGQLLLELWNEDLRAELKLRQAEVEQARSLVDEARVLSEHAEREGKRLSDLRASGITSEEVADKARSEASAAKARLQAAEARVRVRQASVATVTTQLQKTRLLAPFAGQIAEVNAELGEFVTPSPPGIPTLPTIDLIDRGSLYVKAPIDEVDAAAVRVGQEVRVTLDAFRTTTYAGKVRRIAPYVLDREKQSRTVDVEVELVNKKEAARLLPGYSADVEIVLEVRRDVMRVPTETVLQGNKLLIYDATTKSIVERTFDAGVSNWQFTEVLSGLEGNEKVVRSVDDDGVRAGARATIEDERQ